jgi:hypothetical protein
VNALVIVLVLVVVAAIAYGSYYVAKKRRDQLAAFAKQYGFRYSARDPYRLTTYDFKLFRQGEGRGCENVLTGMWQDIPVKVADYWYYTESTDSQGHRTKDYHRFSIVVADVACTTPYVSVDKESIFSKLADHMGFHDIDFESEAFNRAFNVKSPDKAFAFTLIDARMEQFLIDTGGGYGFEFSGPTMLVYCHRLRPTELVPLVGTAKGFVDHIPKLVWTEYGVGPAKAAPAGG